MSEQHIMQVRDLISELQRQPEDAEVAITTGEARYFINRIKYGCARVDDNRRRVNLEVDGEDRIKDLEAQLVEREEELTNTQGLIEEFDTIMSNDDLEQHQRRNQLLDLHDKVKKEFAK